ncbi:unnamed protein product [Spirodela intermedia]|uniref:Uncharacterized protein n=1 Tax=Spirodela intermedia TaxID=51605 RepID=A0A7I8JGC2_SPIIN|nr:unnamed protein product [Spirodela intermedia]CAA6668442.1 unnamed protein product [Spirodela intermedia]
MEETGTATSTSTTGGSEDSKGCYRGHWRHHEDEKLRQLVEKYGPQNWNLIAEKLHGRTGKSCRLRWFNQLDPRIRRTPFTADEEELLLAAHCAHGNRWSLIARLFPGRTTTPSRTTGTSSTPGAAAAAAARIRPPSTAAGGSTALPPLPIAAAALSDQREKTTSTGGPAMVPCSELSARRSSLGDRRCGQRILPVRSWRWTVRNS